MERLLCSICRMQHPQTGNRSGIFVILKTVMENGEELLSTLDSDEELNRVYDLFMEQILSDEEENS